MAETIVARGGTALAAIPREIGPNAEWESPKQITQKTPRIGRCLTVVDTNERPASSRIVRNKQLTSSDLVRHLRQIFDVDMKDPGSEALNPRG